MGSLAAWAYLVALLSTATCERATPQESRPAVAPRPRCTPKSTKTTYVVCVVDEAGRAVVGAQVEAVREQMGEGYGDVGFFDDKLGIRITDANGRAEFAVPPVTGGFLWSAREFSRSATATYARWPPQTAGAEPLTPGTGPVIVVGPPRTVTLRTKLRTCDGTASIGIYGTESWKDLGNGMFSWELGPGAYTYVVRLCEDGHEYSRSVEFKGTDGKNGVIDAN